MMTLTEYRKSLGLTMRVSADLIGVTPQRWGQIERAPETLTVNTIQRICAALGCCCTIDKETLNFEKDGDADN